MSVVKEEIFGPVLAAQRFDDLDEVAKAANDTPYGLAATVWTRDASAMHKIAAKLSAAMVWRSINSATDTPPPLGGSQPSGYARAAVRSVLRASSEPKTAATAL